MNNGMNPPSSQEDWKRLMYVEAWRQHCHEDVLGQNRTTLFIAIQTAFIGIFAIAAKPLLDTAPRAMIWFDQHRLGSPLAFADMSPVHADAGTGVGKVPCETILRHLSNLADVASRFQIRPEIVIYPPVAHFRGGEGFDPARLREAVERLGNHAYETKFFGRGWRRGEKVPDEIVQVKLRHALREWGGSAG